MQNKELLKLKVNLIIVEKISSKTGNPYKAFMIQVGDYTADLFALCSDEKYYILSQIAKQQVAK